MVTPTTVSKITTHDGVSLHVEETGSGAGVLFIHEFAGDHRSWEPQVRGFSRSHRCVTYAARGYLPSDVPPDTNDYSQDHAVADAVAVLDALDLDQAHVVGLSMGGFCALHLGRQHPGRVLSVAIGGVGYGAATHGRRAFQQECEAIAAAIEEEGADKFAERYAVGPARVQFLLKDPRGHAEFTRMLGEHSIPGSAATMRGFQRERPSLYDFINEFGSMETPVLIMVGDEDEGAIEASLMLKRTIPTAGLVIFPRTGHTLNLEEPELFNGTLRSFWGDVQSGAWQPRDPRSKTGGITGIYQAQT